MRPEIAIAPAPTVVSVMEKCEMTPPVKEMASSVSANGPTETAAPKQSFWGRINAACKVVPADVSLRVSTP
ncbi:MAG: hypothetical protein LBJ75_01560 [Puniceicoccales bacterium]|nr:hypothetical protein [Puniceicoccales bacterium]